MGRYEEWLANHPALQPQQPEQTTQQQPTQADNGRGRFSQTRQSYLENAEQKKEQQRAFETIRPQLNFPQYETVEQTRAALKGFEEKNRGLVNDPLSEVLYDGDVKKYTDQINLLSKFESGELGADFFGRGLDENSLAGQMQKDKAATEQRRAEQQYEAEVSQRISDGLSTEGAMNEKFGRTAPTEQQEQPVEEQSAVDRFMSLISGIGKGNAAAATGGQRLLYELGQGARSQMNEEAYAQAKADYDRALQAYEEELAAWGEQGAQSAYYVLQDAKRKLDAFGTVVEDEVQQKATQAASTLSQELNRQSGEDIAKAKEGLGTVGRIAVDTGAALGDILIDAASGMGALNMAGRVFGKSAIEAEAAGANAAQQLAYGTATAAFSTGLNKVIDGLAGVYGKGFGDDAAEAFIAKIASTDKGRNVARAILNIGGEGAEEFTEGAVEPLLKLIYDGGDAIKAVYSSPEAWSEALLDNLYSAAIGSVIGAGGQAVDVARGGYTAKNAATPLQPSDYTAPKTGLKPTSPQSVQESVGDTQIPPSTQTASTNAPDVLNGNIQPPSPIDIVMEVATGQKNTAPTQETPPVSNLGQGGDNGRTSQSASTVFEAGITPETRRAELEPFIQNGRFDYVPDSNARQTVRATRTIMKAGWKKSADDFKADVAAGKSGKDLVARGAVLLNNLSNSDASSQEYMDMVDSYIELMHRAGETLQAGKIVQQLTPEGRLYLIGKSIDRLNRNLTDSQRRKAAKKQGVEADEMRITVDPTLVDMYRAAQTDAERDAVIDEMQQNIAEQVPSTFGEKLTAFRYTAMLGNFKTQIRNLTGNAASVTTKLVKDRLAAAVEAIAKASGAEIEQTRSIAVSPALWKAAWNDFPANRDAVLGEEKYTSASQQIEKGIQDKRTVFKSKALEGWRKGTQWAMQAGDSIFGRIAYADALGGWLQAHNVNFETATDEQLTRARSFAAKEAQEAVFRDKNAISDAVSSLGSNWKNSNSTFKKTVATIGEGIQPFRKTPANVLVRAEEYSPLGFINTVSAAVKSGKGEAEINDVINSAAKAMTGSALAAAGYFLAAAGRLRGVEDDEELDKAQKANGAMDWSFVTDDGKYIALSQFAPATVPLFMGVRLAELTRGQEVEPKDVIEIIKGTTAPMFEMSMLSGLDSAFSDLSNYGSDATAFGQFIENALLSYAQQFIPALLRQAEQASEEYRQTTYTDSNNPWLDTNDQYRLGKISAGIPGLDYQQTDYIDMWGRKTEQGNVADRIFDAFINPTYTAKSKAEPMDDELERLHKATKDLEDVPSVYPSFIARNTKLDKSGKVMTQEQYENYKISTGTKARELASDFVESKEYKKLSDEQRAKVLSDLYSLASSQALKFAKRSQGITGDGLKTDWDTEAKLSDPAKFLAETAIAKANAEKKGETFSTRGADALAYFATKGFADDDMDILAEDMLGDRQAAVYDTMRAAGTSAKDTVSWYVSLDVNNSGVISQDEIYPALKNRDNLTDKQKAVIWENTQTGKTDWAAYLAKNAR